MNILLVTMEMQIGGVETHIFELAKELKKRGNNVYVVSAGGKIADELENFGIVHIYAPLKNKKPKNMLNAYKVISQIIKEKNIEIVHAHARIPAFISGKVCKKLKVPFVTTVHGIYKVNLLLKILTNWGQKTLTVSNDIKKQVIKDYKIPEENIKVTVNGINTENFIKNENKKIRNELKLDDNKFRIVHVSRLDMMSSSVAQTLIEIVEELNKKIECGVQLVIVGNGDKYTELNKLADKHEDIIMTGMRTDVSEILKECNLFVGVSRSALEAMATELPVILAGNKAYGQGYLGIFDETKLKKSIDTNFCCRECEDVTKESLIEDILKIYHMTSEQKESLGLFGRKVVLENYSVKKMVDDTEKLYKEVLR